MDKGALLVFSGLDGAGKSTQIDLLMGRLRARGEEPIYIWARGGYTPLFSALKAIVRQLTRGRVLPSAGKNQKHTQAFGRKSVRRLWLVIALIDLIWLYAGRVRWQRWRGKVIICDRYVWDTLVDFRLNFPEEAVERWWLWRALEILAANPDLAFLLLVPIGESIRRSKIKGEPFPDSRDVLAVRLAEYESLAESGRWHILDGRRPVDDLSVEVQRKVCALVEIDAATLASCA